MAILSDAYRNDELILWEAEQRYTRKKATLIGVAMAGEQNFVKGQILKVSSSNYTPCVAGDTTAAAAVLLEDVTVTDDGTVDVPILYDGPAILNTDRLVSPATTNLAAQKAALVALGIKLVSNPTKVTTAT